MLFSNRTLKGDTAAWCAESVQHFSTDHVDFCYTITVASELLLRSSEALYLYMLECGSMKEPVALNGGLRKASDGDTLDWNATSTVQAYASI